MSSIPADRFPEALARHERGDLAAAERIYRDILATSARPEVQQYLGVLLAQTGRAAEGLELMTRAVAAAPLNVDARFNLAHAFASAGRPADAIVQLRRAVAVAADFLPGWMQLGALLYGERRFDAAAECFARATELAPKDAAARYNLARAHQAAGRLAEATADYRLAVALDPTHVDALNNLGNVLVELDNLSAAIETYRAALAKAPDRVTIRVNLGNALERADRRAEAVAAFEAVLAVEPANREALQGAGKALLALEEHDRAAEMFKRLLAIEPKNLAALLGLGLWHFWSIRYDLARPTFEQAVAVDPKSADAHAHYGAALLMDQADIAGAIGEFRKALELEPKLTFARDHLLFALHYDTRPSPQEIRAEHDLYEKLHAAPLRAHWSSHSNGRDPARRLRVGYVSPDFRTHSCAYFIEPLLAAHDRSRVDVFCYANVHRRDAVTDRLKSLGVTWRDISRTVNADAVDMIRRDAIDILVDLAGHTGDNRLMLFARKPAPVQVTWLGYPDTTGMNAIDYRLTDAVADPAPGADSLASERLVRLADGFLCYRPDAGAPDVTPLPARAEGRITFGAFNNLAKVNDGVVEVWSDVLAAVPRSRLAIKDRRLADRTFGAALVSRFGTRGIASERIVFLPPLATPGEFLKLSGGVDIALDTFPYNGTTTTCEALWMGVPVVTMRGARHSSRVGASLLTRIDRAQWIADDASSYVRIATTLAGDWDRLADERRMLRNRVAASPLRDEAGFARSVEAAYRAMWQDWCRSTR